MTELSPQLNVMHFHSFLGMLLLFQALRIVYRLFFHPLANIPGPKLAAATGSYAAYYTFIKWGQYTNKIVELHQRYGPIIRTHPNEIHVYDREAYDQVFRVGTDFDKCKSFYDHPLGEGSHFNMTDLKSSKLRREAFAPYLSKSAIRKLEPRIQETLLKFIDVLQAMGREKLVIDLTMAFHSFTTDAIMSFAFDMPLGAIEYENFQFPSVALMNEFLIGAVLLRTFHALLRPAFAILFRWPILCKMSRTLSGAVWLREKCRNVAVQAAKQEGTNREILFSTLLRKDRPGQIPSIEQLTAEVIVFLVGGEESTANTLIHGTFHVLSNPEIKSRLLKELHDAIPEEDSRPTSTVLEKLPYLTAIIKESLRFSHGAPGRLPRVVPARSAVICGYPIPAGTRVSMSHYVYHMNHTVFPNPKKFDPDRWLTDDSALLERNLLSFSRGSRGCIGINLAYSELYLAFAYVFRRLDMELYKTKAEDLEWGDFYAPMTNAHLKVILSE